MTDLKSLALKAVPENETLTAAGREDCLICMLPLPFEIDQVAYKTCCGKRLCKGCIVRCLLQHLVEKKIPRSPCAGNEAFLPCPYCRAKLPENDQGVTERAFHRAEKDNDPIAAFHLAMRYSE